MKFLFDHSADFRLISYLSHLGHDVQAISRHFPHGLPDEDVLAIARKEQRILIVADRDFGELIFQQGLAHSGVIFFLVPGGSLQAKIEHLDKLLADFSDKLDQGEFLVVTPGQMCRSKSRTGAGSPKPPPISFGCSCMPAIYY